MSDIIIEGKNLNEIDQSNFQSVGPYVENGSIAVYEPWQGREIDFQGNDTDGRFSLGTITENNRDFWEVQTTDLLTRKSQFANNRLRTARSFQDLNTNLVVSDEVRWSVDTFPFSMDSEGKTTPLYFYYDEKLHSKEHRDAANSTVSFRIELRESGRDQNGIMDNFLLREPFRPFVVGIQAESYDSSKGLGGEVSGEGAFSFGDEIEITATAQDDCHFVRWTEAGTETELSVENPYVFSVPRFDVQLIGNFNSNPKVKFGVKINGVEPNQFPVTNGLGRFLVTDNVLDLVDDFSIASTDSQFSYFNYFRTSEYAYDDDVNQENKFQVFRPETEITFFDYPIGDEYLLQDFSIINQNGQEESIAPLENDVIPDYDRGSKGVYQIPNALSLFSNSFPDNILKIFANYTILYFYVRSINNWFLTDDANQSLTNKQSFVLTFGYGDGEPTFRASQLAQTPPVVYDSDGIDWFQMPIDSSLNMKIDQLLGDGIPGYDIGEWFWYQTPESGSLFGHLTLENDGQPFDQPILDSLTDDDVGMDDGVSLRISYNDNNPSPVATLITGTADAFTYIGYKFKQLGTYVKITKTDDSHDFDVVSPANNNAIRLKENSPELDANMYRLGSNLNWTFRPNLNHQQGEVGEMPEIESIRGWDDTTKTFQTYPNSEVPNLPSVLSALGITYEQDGGAMILGYSLPDSTEDNLFNKYLEFIVKSTIVPPPVAPFVGLFEIEFVTNNADLGTISLLQNADEAPQTELVGFYGPDATFLEFQGGIETPTYAITSEEWHNGDENNVFPIPIDAQLNNNDATLESLSVSLGDDFTARLNAFMNAYLNPNSTPPFAPLSDSQKQEIRDALQGDYLDLSIVNDNSFSISQPPVNQLVRDFLNEGVQKNRTLPRLPIRITSYFEQFFTIGVQTTQYMLSLLPEDTFFITNWNQAAYNANSDISAADTWIDDSLMNVGMDAWFNSSNNNFLSITLPSSFFNGQRELKIRQKIFADVGGSEFDLGPDVFFSPNLPTGGGYATTEQTDGVTAFDWTTRISNLTQNVTISLNWAGNA